MYFFTADEHYGHTKIIIYQNRPFKDITEHDDTMIANLNSVVTANDTVVHAGDTFWAKDYRTAQNYTRRLKGNHIFLKGSHDKWLPRDKSMQIWEKYFGKDIYLVVCHYAMHAWARSHYNSLHLYGHSHRDLELPGKRHCISVENTNYYPLSFDQVKEIMAGKDDNPNFIKPEDRNNANMARKSIQNNRKV